MVSFPVSSRRSRRLVRSDEMVITIDPCERAAASLTRHGGCIGLARYDRFVRIAAYSRRSGIVSRSRGE